METKKEPQQKVKGVRAPATRLKVHLKISLSIALYCPAPLHCVEQFAAWQASKAIFQMLCSRCDNYKMHHLKILVFIWFS